jgi:dipeptidyl aminopeptidase/acylaminoacyl peptidase
MLRHAALLFVLAIAAAASAQDASAQDAKPRSMRIDDLFRFKRLADPQISPDGKWVVYVQGVVDVEDNRINNNLWLVSTDPGRAGSPKQLTAAPKSDRHPRWSPDGKHVLFESNRSGTNQLWLIAIDGGEPKQLTTISTGAATGIWSRDGKRIAFVSAVWPEYSARPFAESDALNKKRSDAAEKNPVKAKVFTRLFFRHWDEYVQDKRQHLFVMDVKDQASGLPSVGEPRDVTPGDRDAHPTSMTFSVGDDFTFSPDGKHLVFTAVPERDEAWSTNYDICRVPVTGGAKTWECLTAPNPAADGAPQFSADGKKLAYRSQKRPGAEADRWVLTLVNVDESGAFLGAPRGIAMRWSVDEFAWATIWSRDVAGPGLLFIADDKGSRPIQAIAPNGDIFRASLTTQGSHGSLSASRDGKRYAFTLATMGAPAEVYADSVSEPAGAGPAALSRANVGLLRELDLPKPESVAVAGAGGTPMQMWILKPPGFDAAKNWPLVYLVHGGPQGAWDDGWSYRWNPQAWAAQGYVVALPNPRGSTGFGQKYVDEISGDWGGKCYEDLMAGLAYLERQPWIDSQRMAAAGASFGGYMMNWFAVNTGKFKTLITHCGVWNFDSMYATTEELWFDEWEHGGPPWGKNRHSYENHSPHRLAANLGKFKTPMLIIHNDLDFRVPVSEGIQLFTTLQRQGVPSRFINFPDEGHWVLKPRNSQFWHREVFGWLRKHVAPGGR